jgi:hypothetical protein
MIPDTPNFADLFRFDPGWRYGPGSGRQGLPHARHLRIVDFDSPQDVPQMQERCDLVSKWGDWPLIQKLETWLTQEIRPEPPQRKGKGKDGGRGKGGKQPLVKGKSKTPTRQHRTREWQQFVEVDSGGWADIRAVAYKANVSVSKLVCLAKALHDDQGHPVLEIAVLDPGITRKGTIVTEDGDFLSEETTLIDPVPPLVLDASVFPILARHTASERFQARVARLQEEGELEEGIVDDPEADPGSAVLHGATPACPPRSLPLATSCMFGTKMCRTLRTASIGPPFASPAPEATARRVAAGTWGSDVSTDTLKDGSRAAASGDP